MKIFNKTAKNAKKPKGTRLESEALSGIETFYSGGGEQNYRLRGEQKYITYKNVLANQAIIAACVRFYLETLSSSTWTFTPSDADTSGKYARFVQAALQHDSKTPLNKIIKKLAMGRIYGFALLEWSTKKQEEHEDLKGFFTFADVAHRPQRSITEWRVDDEGYMTGITQHSRVKIKRNRLAYYQEDSFTDDPEGMGVLRSAIKAIDRLTQYIDLETVGFESDLRGIPVGRAPRAEIDAAAENSGNPAAAQKALSQFRSYLQRKVKAGTAILLDSSVYESTGDEQKPSSNRKWDLDVVKSESSSHKEVAEAIQRTTYEVALAIGAERLLLGGDGGGSNGLSEDKAKSFSLTMESVLTDLQQVITNDLIKALFRENGFDMKFLPNITTELPQYNSVSEITLALRDLASAGAPILPDDPVVDFMRAKQGLPAAKEPTPEQIDTIMGKPLPNTQSEASKEKDGQDDRNDTAQRKQ